MQEAQQRSLTKEQKEAVGILSIGTFFEQFDIMLYIHMAVLLNELFFLHLHFALHLFSYQLELLYLDG